MGSRSASRVTSVVTRALAATLVLFAATLLPPEASGAPPSGPAGPAPHQQAMCFEETGLPFCVENMRFRDYFLSRGGKDILGYPVSREFMLEGFPVQFFQRVVLQLNAGQVARLNVLDTTVMPLTRANESTFPGPDPGMTAAAPRTDDPRYAEKAIDFINTYVPETWPSPSGQRVGFLSLFRKSIRRPDPNLELLANVEIWGLPTSRPAFDPNNARFIYQRFQRGIMHFRTDCNCAEGVLVGDYFKSVITNRQLPPDLRMNMSSSRYFDQYRPGAPNWLARPWELPNTNLTRAFGDLLTGTVGGVVTHERRGSPPPQPVANAAVEVFDLPGTAAATGANGRFAFPNMPYGDHFLVATTPFGTSDLVPASLGSSAVEVPIALLTDVLAAVPVLITGVVQGSGPIPGATAWVLGTPFRTVTDSKGQFRLPYISFDAVNKPPTIVAATGDRWGFVRPTDPRRPATVTLDRAGPAPPAPKQVYDFIANAPKAQWRNATEPGLELFGLPDTDARGFARLLGQAELEDGSIGERVLETHPEWKAGGTISGRYLDLLTPQAGDSFQAVVGLLQNARAGSVTFQVVFVLSDPDRPGRVPLVTAQDTFDGRLVPLAAPFPPEAVGRGGWVMLIVEAGETSAQDWAVWLDAQVVRRP